MVELTQNKRKIINDPVYGFVNIPSELVFDIIGHPNFQRLRRIKQLGLTNFVYPGANHTRFQHAIGAMHLMTLAIQSIQAKGIEIIEEEAEAVTLAILLHDVGHGPYSHALEHSLMQGINHEDISVYIMHQLNQIFNGKLTLAIKIFKNEYHKKFLHQLVSSQLDMDRLDYLKRDSFFTGVTEGVVGSDRIIKMLNVHNDELVVDSKGIYSIEKFLIARRLMFWQVYLHKTVVSTENLLVKTLQRAKQLAKQGQRLFAPPALSFFLDNNISKADLFSDKELLNNVLEQFSQLDDSDIISSIKVWCNHSDKVLSFLSESFINRRLYKIEIQNEPFDAGYVGELQAKTAKKYGLCDEDTKYLTFTGEVTTNTYDADADDDRIKILFKSGKLVDISEASDMLNVSVLSRVTKKSFLCCPKEISI